MERLDAELERARELSVDDLADAIESIGFECTRCGACCKANEGCGDDGSTADGGTDADADVDSDRDAADADAGDGDGDPHTATVFPDEVRSMQDAAEETFDETYDWRDVARPMPYGVSDGEDGPAGETLEWAIQTDDCGDCTFYEEAGDGTGACTVHADRPLVCRTYPFSLSHVDERQHDGKDILGLTEPMGGVVEQEGMVRAHECEGLGRDISREDALEMAENLKERAIRELKEAIGVRDNYQPTTSDGVIVHDSEGQKRPDGIPYSPTDQE